MKAKMNQTLKLAGTYNPQWTFHKGRTYEAVLADNQPDYKSKGLIFVRKDNGQSMLVSVKAGLNPQIAEMEKKQHEIENNLAYEKAVRDFAKTYPDFNEEEVVNFSRDFDVWNKPKDMLQLMYWALKGSQLPDLIEKAKTEVVLGAKTKKGLPPIGQKTVPPKEFGKTLQEQYEAAKKRIASEGPLF